MEFKTPWNKTITPHDSDFLAANIPQRHWGASLDVIPDGTEYKAIIARYFTDLESMIREGVGLLLWGPYRSGKTAIACLLAREVLRHCVSVYFTEAFFLVTGMIGENKAATSLKMLRSGLLIIDDLGMEHGKEFTHATVDLVLRHRAERQRATIITTNLEPGGLEQEYGDKFMSISKTGLYPVKIDGKNWGEDEERAIRRRFEG